MDEAWVNPAHLHAWLRRVRRHPQASALVLRGSLLTRALCGGGRRAMDVDYLVLGRFDPDATVRLAGEIASLPEATSALRVRGGAVIWAETAFPGVRVTVEAEQQGEAPQTFQVDFAFGDPLSQPPRILALEGVGDTVCAAPESLWAWKLHGLVEFGRGRWRAKDLYDLALLCERVPLDAEPLPAAVALAFSSRGTPLSELDDFRHRENWGCAVSSGRKWRSFLRKQGLEADLLEVRERVRDRVEAILGAIHAKH